MGHIPIIYAQVFGSLMFATIQKYIEKLKVEMKKEGQFYFYINSKRNTWFELLHFFSFKPCGEILHNICLLQYHIHKENCDEEVYDVALYGNRKISCY